MIELFGYLAYAPRRCRVLCACLHFAVDGAAAYQDEGLPVQPVNIKSRVLDKFDKRDAIWTCASTGVDMNVIGFLMRHWPLDHDAR